MASSTTTGTSSGGSSTKRCGSEEEEELQRLMDQRKRRRMISNRESARRSRMRKQQHLDELAAQVAELRKENGQIIASYKIVTQQYLAVEAENSVLRTQMAELTSRLQSMNEILGFLGAGAGGDVTGGGGGGGGGGDGYYGGDDLSPWLNVVSVI